MNEDYILDNVNMVYKLASKFYGVERDDLIQAGLLGLRKAYINYDSSYQAKFSTYAHDYIYGEMYQLASKKMIKVNKDTLKIYKYIEKTRYEQAQLLGRIPNNYELSNIINMPVETIDFACNSAIEILSLDNDNEYERSLHERIKTDEKVDIIDSCTLKDGLNKLPIDEKNIIESRYFEDKTQSEIANELRMTQVMVSRLEKKGIQRMREYMTS